MTRETECGGMPHPKAVEGIQLFNNRKFFEAHEELELAWREEPGGIRDLYRGILQVSVAYLHILRANFNGAVKVHARSQHWLRDWPNQCRGIDVARLRDDADHVFLVLTGLGPQKIGEFDPGLFQPIRMENNKLWQCDRCGSTMVNKNCKITCPNCGNRFDCSDLNIYFD